MTRPAIHAGPDEGEDPDIPDLDDEPLNDAPVEQLRRPTKSQARRREPDADPDRDGPTFDELMEEVVGLRERNRKNNQELAKRRQVQQFMETHEIEDLDSWLARIGVDRQTGQPVAQPSPAPAAPTAPADLDRLVALEVEKAQARHEAERADWETRHDTLSKFLARAAFETAMAKAGFTGPMDRALRVTDMDSITVEIGEDGPAITGVDEAVASLRADIAEWFRPPRNGRPARTGGDDVDGGRKPPAKPARPTWEQQVAGRLTGQR